MGFEWDEDKRRANKAKHGLDFEDAPETFDAFWLEKLDQREDYGEDRWAALGSCQGRIVYLVYTTRGENKRIISMRKATGPERSVYEQALKKRLGQG